MRYGPPVGTPFREPLHVPELTFASGAQSITTPNLRKTRASTAAPWAAPAKGMSAPVPERWDTWSSTAPAVIRTACPGATAEKRSAHQIRRLITGELYRQSPAVIRRPEKELIIRRS